MRHTHIQLHEVKNGGASYFYTAYIRKFLFLCVSVCSYTSCVFMSLSIGIKVEIYMQNGKITANPVGSALILKRQILGIESEGVLNG